MFDLTDSRTKATAWKIAALIILVLFVFFGIRAVVQSFVVEGPSMEPGLHGGQFILVNKAAYWFGSPQRGDIVVFKAPPAPSRIFIKRVIALPGDTVRIEDGQIYIDGELLPEPSSILEDSSDYGPVAIPPDYYFVLGDNRNHSDDSRDWGLLPRGNIIGKAWLSIWPLSEWGFVPNYSLEAGGQ